MYDRLPDFYNSGNYNYKITPNGFGIKFANFADMAFKISFHAGTSYDVKISVFYQNFMV